MPDTRDTATIEGEIALLSQRRSSVAAELDIARPASDPFAAPDVFMQATAKVAALEAVDANLDQRLAALDAELQSALDAEDHAAKVERLTDLAREASEARAGYEAAYVAIDQALAVAVAPLLDQFARWSAARRDFRILADALTRGALSHLRHTYNDARAAEMQTALDGLMGELAGVDVSSALAVGLWLDTNPEVSYPYFYPPARFAEAVELARRTALVGNTPSLAVDLLAVAPAEVAPVTAPAPAGPVPGETTADAFLRERQNQRAALPNALLAR